jgi:hypothetical protein
MDRGVGSGEDRCSHDVGALVEGLVNEGTFLVSISLTSEGRHQFIIQGIIQMQPKKRDQESLAGMISHVLGLSERAATAREIDKNIRAFYDLKNGLSHSSVTSALSTMHSAGTVLRSSRKKDGYTLFEYKMAGSVATSKKQPAAEDAARNNTDVLTAGDEKPVDAKRPVELVANMIAYVLRDKNIDSMMTAQKITSNIMRCFDVGLWYPSNNVCSALSIMHKTNLVTRVRTKNLHGAGVFEYCLVDNDQARSDKVETAGAPVTEAEPLPQSQSELSFSQPKAPQQDRAVMRTPCDNRIAASLDGNGTLHLAIPAFGNSPLKELCLAVVNAYATNSPGAVHPGAFSPVNDVLIGEAQGQVQDSEPTDIEDGLGALTPGAWEHFERTHLPTVVSSQLGVSKCVLRMYKPWLLDKKTMAKQFLLDHLEAFAFAEMLKSVASTPAMAAVAAARIGFLHPDARSRLELLAKEYCYGKAGPTHGVIAKLRAVLDEVPQGQRRGDRVRVWSYHTTEKAIEAFVTRQSDFVVPEKDRNYPLLAKIPELGDGDNV